MKYLILVVSLFATAAIADTLKCWNTHSKSRRPALVADIVGDNVLKNVYVKFRPYGDVEEVLIDYKEAAVVGELITSKRSPYKGNNSFIIPKAAEMIFPTSLKNSDLVAAEKTGIGYGRGENGVLITSYEQGAEGGSHISLRLRCRSYE